MDLYKDSINEFIGISSVPRSCLNCEKILDYLFSWAKEHSFVPNRDTYGNFWMDIDATSGKEMSKKCILQAHMDMVPVVEEGFIHDFTEEGLSLVIDEEKIFAKHTSLGADDGIGMAVILAIAKNEKNFSHGPFRVLFTADEDIGLLGSSALPEEVLSDFDYLINNDAEGKDIAVISSAGGTDFEIEDNLKTEQAEGEAFFVSLRGLKGGHSGIDITKNRLSAFSVLQNILKSLNEENISYQIGDINMGTAVNAIANFLDFQIKFLPNETENGKNLIKKILKANQTIEKYSYEIKRIDNIRVLTKEASSQFVYFLTSLSQGVICSSPLVSCNTGIIRQNLGSLEISIYLRSNDEPLFTLQKSLINDSISRANLKYSIKSDTSPWPEDKNNPLIELAKEACKFVTGRELILEATHGGLETSDWGKKNPNLKMICLSMDIRNAHTNFETLYLNSVSNNVNIIKYILEKI